MIDELNERIMISISIFCNRWSSGIRGLQFY